MESSEPEASPEAKRLHSDFLLDILDDDDDVADSGDRDLASVMRILEEEIALPPPPPHPEPAESVSDLSDPPRLAELGYLLEASDDELGLPPAPSSSPEPKMPAAEGEETAEVAGFGQIWGFDDEIFGYYDGFGLGIRPEEEEEEEGAGAFDDGTFDYGDVLFCGPSEFSWRGESLPAVRWTSP